jgi:hypothetical protein
LSRYAVPLSFTVILTFPSIFLVDTVTIGS